MLADEGRCAAFEILAMRRAIYAGHLDRCVRMIKDLPRGEGGSIPRQQVCPGVPFQL